MNTDDSESHAHSDPTMDLSRADFGSCVAAFAVNDRLTVIRTEHRSVDAFIVYDIAHTL